MRSKLGNYVTFNGTRFATGSEATALNVVRNGYFYEIGRIDSQLRINEWGGTGTGRELGEYNRGDNGNKLKFIDAEGNEMLIESLGEPTMIEVTLETPGTLGVEIINQVDVLSDVERLKITGTLNSADWTTISNLNSIFEVDMSAASAPNIPNNAFQGKTYLRKVKLPQNTVTIGQDAFKQTALKDIVIPASVTNIGSYSFTELETLKEVTFEEGSQLRTVSNGAFYNCTALKRIHIPEGCTTIMEYAFHDCNSLVEITLPTTLTTIERYAFYNTTNLKELIFPEKLASIGYQAFYNSGLTSIILPAGLSTLGSEAFRDCTSATKIQLPSYIAQYDNNFRYCTNVKEVICPSATPPAYYSTSYPFSYVVISAVTLTVPDFAVASYKLDTYWMQFGKIQGGAEVSLCNVAGPLSLTNDRRIDGTPDVTILVNGSITLGGQAPQEFGTLAFQQNFSNSSSYAYSQFINNSPLVSANKLINRIYVYANTWYFLSPVGNILRSQISHADASAAFAIRRYSGQKRAENGSGGWTNLADDELLEGGKGYILQTNKEGWVTLDFELANPSDLTEILNSGNISLELEDWPAEIAANAGWNFLGNPYPSHFDTHFLDFPAPITVYDPANRNYRAYSLSDDNFVLKPMQPFFVQKPAGVDEVTFLKNGRQLSNTPNTSAYQAVREQSSLRVICNVSMTGKGLSDATRVVVNPQASLAYEPNFDAAKMMSTETDALQLWSVGEGNIPMAINERPVDSGIVALAAMVPSAGEYEISVDCADKSVAILDRQTSVIARSHSLQTNDAQLVDNRYALVIEGATSGLTETIHPASIVVNGRSVSSAVDAVVYAIDGRVVTHLTAGAAVTLRNGVYVAKGADGSVAKFTVNVEGK